MKKAHIPIIPSKPSINAPQYRLEHRVELHVLEHILAAFEHHRKRPRAKGTEHPEHNITRQLEHTKHIARQLGREDRVVLAQKHLRHRRGKNRCDHNGCKGLERKISQ